MNTKDLYRLEGSHKYQFFGNDSVIGKFVTLKPDRHGFVKFRRWTRPSYSRKSQPVDIIQINLKFVSVIEELEWYKPKGV